MDDPTRDQEKELSISEQGQKRCEAESKKAKAERLREGEDGLSSLYSSMTEGVGLANHAILMRKDGTELPIDDSGAPIRNQNGETVGAVLVFRDITERRRNEEVLRKSHEELELRVRERTAELVKVNEMLRMEIEERKRMEEDLANANKELESFNYTVSHDLRAPLRAINGFSQILFNKFQDMFDVEGREYVEIIRSECNRMGKMISDLLDLSRLSRKEIDREEVDMSDMVESIAVELQRMEPERRVHFVIQPGIRANGDRVLLRSVLENLINNSWKFTSNHPEARIEFGVSDQDGRRRYFVRDDGAGFDMLYANKLFGIFQRLHGVDEFQGNGIGLAIIERIIHHHGGKVWAEGAVDKGATFYFTIS
jgi:light-regulated signal transduction histidine kinase (bacteriophytochrome)